MRISAIILSVSFLAGSSGLAFAQSAMTDAQIQQKLQSEGYTDVKITKHDGNHIDATATMNGKVEKLEVDPKTGAAKPGDDD